MAAPLVVFALLALVVAGCESPDASDVTSPSGRALLGTTSGTATYESDSTPPQPIEDAEGWEFFLGNARYETLENEQASLQVVTRTTSQAGATMEVWVWRDGQTALHWQSGTTTRYDGVFCFQFRLEDDGESLQLEPREQYYLTMAFRDEESGDYVAVQEIRVAGVVPELGGEAPGEDSRVGSELLGCPRSVI